MSLNRLACTYPQRVNMSISEMSNKMKIPMVTLVTVTFNSKGDLSEFFASVKDQDYPNLSIVVVDNASSDGTIEVLNAECAISTGLHIIENTKNYGIAVGNNQGIEKALALGSDWVILINNDVSFKPGLVEKLVESDSESLLNVRTPTIPYFSDHQKVWFHIGRFSALKGWTGVHSDINTRLADVINLERKLYVSYAPTCCMAIHKSVFGRVGMMDEDFFVYFDDTDFCMRLQKNDVRIRVYEDAYLYHKVGSSTGGVHSDFTISQTSKNRIIYLRKHKNSFYLVIFIPLFIGFYFVRYMMLSLNLRKFILAVKGLFLGARSKIR